VVDRWVGGLVGGTEDAEVVSPSAFDDRGNYGVGHKWLRGVVTGGLSGLAHQLRGGQAYLLAGSTYAALAVELSHVVEGGGEAPRTSKNQGSEHEQGLGGEPDAVSRAVGGHG